MLHLPIRTFLLSIHYLNPEYFYKGATAKEIVSIRVGLDRLYNYNI